MYRVGAYSQSALPTENPSLYSPETRLLRHIWLVCFSLSIYCIRPLVLIIDHFMMILTDLGHCLKLISNWILYYLTSLQQAPQASLFWERSYTSYLDQKGHLHFPLSITKLVTWNPGCGTISERTELPCCMERWLTNPNHWMRWERYMIYPDDYGFMTNSKGNIVPRITDKGVAPAYLLKEIKCSCTKPNRDGVMCSNCNCTKSGLSCTDLCICNAEPCSPETNCRRTQNFWTFSLI